MGRVRSGVLVAVAAALVMSITASGASAKHVHLHVNIKDQNGYRMSIEASRSARGVVGIASRKVSGPNPPAALRSISRRQAAQVDRMSKSTGSSPRPASGFVSVQVENGHAISTYSALGTVTHNRLVAKLGNLGRVSLHFHLHHARTHRNLCKPVHERLGTFTGRVRFRGEGGYVNVDARRLRGKVELRERRSRCGFIRIVPPGRVHHKAGSKARPHRRKTERYTVLYADRETESKFTILAAAKENREESDYYAVRFATRGQLLIDRLMAAGGKARDFKTSKRVTTARIHPSSRAFRGTGHYKGDHRWTGSLTTSFPGAPKVRLAGRGFHAHLARYDRR